MFVFLQDGVHRLIWRKWKWEMQSNRSEWLAGWLLCTEEDFAMAGKSVEEAVAAAASTSAEQPSRSSPFSLRRLPPTLAALVFLYFCEAKIPQNGQPISTDWIGTRGPLIYRCQERSARRKRHPVNRGGWGLRCTLKYSPRNN